ncbi:MAG: hypothetical protein ACOX7R_03170 [Acetivibrionales bacterium]|jgi:epoxyqueuosine reductase
MDLKQLTINKAKELGADIVGIASVERWKSAPEMLRPDAHLPDAKSVIVMGIHHPDASVEWGGIPNSNYAGPFQIGMIPKLDTMSRHLAKFIEKKGEKAIPYPCTGFWRHRPYKEIETANTASFSHRHAAVAAGLGEFGLNNLFMSPQFGPRQRLVSVITSAEMEADALYSGVPLCDECRMCAKHCPGNNFADENLLYPGVDTVTIENKTYKYSKLNRWRCLWGEQFAFDMNKLKDLNVKKEEDLLRADEVGIERKGGEFGSCIRYCMAKNLRYWDRKYTTAPRRKKDRATVSNATILENIKKIAVKNGAQVIDIRSLKDFAEEQMKLSEGYPITDMKKNFSTVVSIASFIPAFPEGCYALHDCEDYVKAAIKVRMSIASYEIAQYLDNLGCEAMQDWMSLGEQIDFFRTQSCMVNEGDELLYKLDENEVNLTRQERYKVAADNKTGVQREQQSMTAGQQGQREKKKNDRFISCSVITNIVLDNVKILITPFKQDYTQELSTLDFLREIDLIGVASIDKVNRLPDILDLKKVMPSAKSLITLAISIPQYIVKLAGEQKAECASSYAMLQYQTLRELIWASHDLCTWLRSKGYRSLPIADASMASIRTVAPYWEFSWSKLGHPDPRANAPLAVATGIGQLGQSGMLLTKQYGPNQRFVFVLTEAELEPTQHSKDEICLHCGSCAVSCPMQAIDDNNFKQIEVGERIYRIYERSENLCEWARSMCISDKTTANTIGWKKQNIPVPENMTLEDAKRILNEKDQLQVRGYLYQCQIETIVEKCMQNCPAGYEDRNCKDSR